MTNAAVPVAAASPTARAALQYPAWLSPRAVLAWWALSLVLLLAFLGNPPVQRTQEARVMETAREMLDGHWRRWLIPQFNGDLRLRKPPLTYWAAAAAFKVGGITDTHGRVPTAVVGWLTVAVTFLAAERLVGRRAAFFAAGMLLASYLFFRHARLAETDAPAALCVTAAVYAILRASGVANCGAGFPACTRPPAAALPAAKSAVEWEGEAPAEPGSQNPARQEAHPPGSTPNEREVDGEGAVDSCRLESLHHNTPWLYAAALATSLAFLTKGGPGLFPLFFLPAFCALTGRWDVLRRFFTTGAVAVVVVVGLSWYAYAASQSGLKQFFQELRELRTGADHGGTFLVYFPMVLVATAPWTGLVLAGLVEAGLTARRDVAARVMLAWVGATFVPLCFAGNKQVHYLMPVMPSLMVLAGWAADAACGGVRARPGFVGASRVVFKVTAGAMFLGVLALPWVARTVAGPKARPLDLAVAAGLLVLLVCAPLVRKAYGRTAGAAALVVVVAAAMPVLMAVWYPTLRPNNPRAVAAAVRRQVGGGPYCFFGGNISLPLVWNLRTEIPWVADDNRGRDPGRSRDQLLTLALAADEAGGRLVVIAQTKDGKAPRQLGGNLGPFRIVPVPPPIPGEEQEFNLYRVERK